MANLVEWKSRQLWTLIEAACLMTGEELVEATEFIHIHASDIAGRFYGDLKDSTDLGTLKSQKSRTGHIGNRRIKPEDCVKWARGRGYNVPAVFDDLGPPEESAADRRTRYIKEIAAERNKGNPTFRKTVADREGISVQRLDQIIKKNPTEESSNAWQGLVSPGRKTSSKKTS